MSLYCISIYHYNIKSRLAEFQKATLLMESELMIGIICMTLIHNCVSPTYLQYIHPYHSFLFSYHKQECNMMKSEMLCLWRNKKMTSFRKHPCRKMLPRQHPHKSSSLWLCAEIYLGGNESDCEHLHITIIIIIIVILVFDDTIISRTSVCYYGALCFAVEQLNSISHLLQKPSPASEAPPG